MGGSIEAGEIHFSSEFMWRERAGVPIRTPSFFFLSFYHYFCILMIIYVPEKHKEENKNNILQALSTIGILP